MFTRKKRIKWHNPDDIDGCDALASLPPERHVTDQGVLLLTLTASVEDRNDHAAILAKLDEYLELFPD